MSLEQHDLPSNDKPAMTESRRWNPHRQRDDSEVTVSVQASAQLLLKYTRSTWGCLADGHEHNSFEVEMRACLVQLSKEVASYADQSQTEAARASDEAEKALSAGKITREHLEFYREEEQISSKDIARLTHALKVLLDDSRAFANATEHYVRAPVESNSTE